MRVLLALCGVRIDDVGGTSVGQRGAVQSKGESALGLCMQAVLCARAVFAGCRVQRTSMLVAVLVQQHNSPYATWCYGTEPSNFAPRGIETPRYQVEKVDFESKNAKTNVLL